MITAAALAWVALTLAQGSFASDVDRAVRLAQSGNLSGARTALERSRMEAPESFATNHLDYLAGRIAENANDWMGAADSFSRVPPGSPLRPLAAWHAARAALRLGAMDRATAWVEALPADFPDSLRIELAREAPPAVALRLLGTMTGREARSLRARILDDRATLWTLVRSGTADEAALIAARALAPNASTAQEWRDLAVEFLAQRQFQEARQAAERLAPFSEFAAEAAYLQARVQFYLGDYAGAARAFTSVAERFESSSWAKEAAYQEGISHWRALRYAEAAEALSRYVERYPEEGPTRDLVDVYRALGETTKAVGLIDRALARRPSAGLRQVLLFAKARIRYGEGRYAAALDLVRQLKRVRIRAVAGGTSAEELAYFEALCLAKTGKSESARSIWRRLANSARSYYGQQASRQLGLSTTPAAAPCLNRPPVDGRVVERLLARRRPLLQEGEKPVDAVTELVFLGLWDEASLWLDRARRPDPVLAADLAYAGQRYSRAILLADRLPDSAADVQQLRFPSAYRDTICAAAAKHGVDAHWLHAIIWQESKYDPDARSAAAARGLMQIVPDTAETVARSLGVSGLTTERLFTPEINIELGAAYWAGLIAEFKIPELALAAYNGGPENVRRWRDKVRSAEPDLFVFEIGFTETKRYVQAVFGAYAAYRSAD